ncbi:hypothetical protein BRADI_1g20085v3 [Brachypodium distachyon]|uniref:Uncharacterized protein n=1 Tax=Brachypodium distachyon TaxID=15368 RepID=A0A0Q3JSG9_BRADI|nr:hypothetical protein BRADI_1g20085v3 [Brachypodium distachyon]
MSASAFVSSSFLIPISSPDLKVSLASLSLSLSSDSSSDSVRGFRLGAAEPHGRSYPVPGVAYSAEACGGGGCLLNWRKVRNFVARL